MVAMIAQNEQDHDLYEARKLFQMDQRALLRDADQRGGLVRSIRVLQKVLQKDQSDENDLRLRPTNELKSIESGLSQEAETRLKLS